MKKKGKKMCQPKVQVNCNGPHCEETEIGPNQDRISTIDHDGRHLFFCSWDCNNDYSAMMVKAENEVWMRKAS